MTSETDSLPPASAGGCVVCGKTPAPYRAPDGAKECQNHHKIRQRRERGLKAPGPKPDPTKARSRHGAARANEGTQSGKVGRPRRKPGDPAEEVVRKRTGETVVRRFATETHCANGHLWAEAGFYLRSDPRYAGGQQKVCRLCQRAALQKYRGREVTPGIVPIGPRNGDKTHCPQGHEYTARNTGSNPDGSRFCRRCRRDRRIQDTYGLSPEQWDAMLIVQCGRCASCRDPLLDPQVDHNHVTGSVRGLLCMDCNIMLGHAKDDPARLLAGVEYLKRDAQGPVR